MSDAEPDPELTALLADLTRTLRELQAEVEPNRGPRLPTPGELSRFTSEVAIPGLILVLETNIRALELLRRAIRLADGRDPTPGSTASEVRSRAEDVGAATLTQLEGTLAELQSALEGRPPDDEARSLLEQAQQLQEEVRNELATDERLSGNVAAESSEAVDIEVTEGDPETTDEVSSSVDIDVESELQTLKDNIETAEDDGGATGDERDGTEDAVAGGDDTDEHGDGTPEGDAPGDGATDGDESGDSATGTDDHGDGDSDGNSGG